MDAATSFLTNLTGAGSDASFVRYQNYTSILYQILSIYGDLSENL